MASALIAFPKAMMAFKEATAMMTVIIAFASLATREIDRCRSVERGAPSPQSRCSQGQWRGLPPRLRRGRYAIADLVTTLGALCTRDQRHAHADGHQERQRGLGHPFPWEGKGVAALSLHLPSLPPLWGGGGEEEVRHAKTYGSLMGIFGAWASRMMVNQATESKWGLLAT